MFNFFPFSTKNNNREVIYLITFQFLFSFCISCGNDKTIIQITHHLQEKGLLTIFLDSLTSIESTSVNPVYFGDTLHLFIANELNNSVDVYEEATGKLSKRFRFEREGPGGISQIRTTVVKSRDSIFVIGKFHIANSKLINWKGEIINSRPINFEWGENKYNIVNHVSNIIPVENFWYITIGPLFDIGNPKSFNQSISFEYRYDIKGQNLEELPVFEPENYANQPHNFYSVVPSRVVDKENRLVYSWPEDEKIEVRSLQKIDSVFRFNAHINVFGELLNGSRSGPSGMDQLKEALDHVLYVKILYDPYRNLFYRIASLPTGEYKPEDLRHWTAFGRNRIGIIILDMNFQIAGYEILPAGKYNCYRAFVGKKGLYLSKNNIFREDFDENLLEYAIFEPVSD
jgi:hypothetical protein